VPGERLATFLEIASNNACNLSCVYCYGLGHPEPARFDAARYGSLLDELLPRADILVPSAGSEPFAAEIGLAVAKVVQHKKRLLLITNGTYPLVPVLGQAADRLYRLQVSIDSHLPELYERLRPGAKFQTVLSNLRAAVALLREKKIPHRLVVSIVLTRDNAATVVDTVRFFRADGVEAFLIQELYEFDPRLSPYRPSKEQVESARAGLRQAARVLSADILFANIPVQRFNGRPKDAPAVEWDPANIVRHMRENPGLCWQAWEWLKVHPGGAVHPCCVAPAELLLGNLNERPLEKILASGAREKLQRRLREGNPPQACRSCPLLRQIAQTPEEFR